MYVLDANTLIHFFKGAGQVADRMLQVPPEEIGIPAVVLYELEVGIPRAPNRLNRRDQLLTLLKQVRLLPFGQAEAAAAAELRVELERVGKPIGPHDALIAGTALAARATLVTHNKRGFKRVPGLTVEDWY